MRRSYYISTHFTDTGHPGLRTKGPAPPADLLAEAFAWGEWRTVTSTAQVSLHGNLYDVDPLLAGTRVELVFNPFDLTDIDVRAHSRSYGKATPTQIRRVGRAARFLRKTGPFPRGPPPNRTCTFPRIRLSSDLPRGRVAAPFTQDTRHRFGNSHYAYLPAFECPIT